VPTGVENVFTGLVEATGTLLEQSGGQLRFSCPFAAELVRGESVSVSGVCLTVEDRDRGSFRVTAVPITLQRTTLGRLTPGAPVNLERALAVGARLGGHVVQGHVDAVGQVVDRRDQDDGLLLVCTAPPAVLRYVVPRGAIAMEGVSLTVAERWPDRFAVAIIPHTAAVTTLGQARPGTPVNVEADVLAKYVEGLLAARDTGPAGGGP
jgi:riboflavin synthase